MHLDSIQQARRDKLAQGRIFESVAILQSGWLVDESSVEKRAVATLQVL